MRVRIIGYGAAIQSVYVPDAQGRFADVTTGYDTRDAYVAQPHYFGSTIGRVANGIADARFTLDGKEYLVPANDGGNAVAVQSTWLAILFRKFFRWSTIGKAGKSYYRGDAIALEPQMFPDAPNQASFASVALHPYMMYENMIIWQFGATAPNADEHLPQ